MSLRWVDDLKASVPGLALATALAALAIGLGALHFFNETLHVGPLLLVIILGMAFTSVLKLPQSFEPGIRFAQRPVLRLAVAGLGFKVSLTELLAIGGPALAVVALSTTAALAFGYWIARRMGLSHNFSLLLSIGGGICGASAIVAADSLVQAKERDVAFSLGVITLLGTIGIVVYPPIGHLLGMAQTDYGIWTGASLHEMAQVVAAGVGFGDVAGSTATVAKLARIALLTPVILGLGLWMRKSSQNAGQAKVPLVPWFLVGFLVLVALNSLDLLTGGAAKLPEPFVQWALTIDTWLLCIGMAGVGLHSGLGDLKSAGIRPIAAGALQWVFLAALSFGLTVLLVR